MNTRLLSYCTLWLAAAALVSPHETWAAVARPTLKITAPTSGQRWSNSVFTVKGTATGKISNVKVAVNDGVFQLANVASNNAWNLQVTSLIPGTNTIRAYAVGTNGVSSTTNKASMMYVKPTPFHLNITPEKWGSVSGASNNQALEIGRNYKVTAKPYSSNVFVAWKLTLGSVSSTYTTPSLTFMMREGASLTAKFDSFLPSKGTYKGLFVDTNSTEVTNSGAFTLTLELSGKFSGSLRYAAGSNPFSGKFDLNQSTNALINIRRTGKPTLILDLALRKAGSEFEITGTVKNGSSTADIGAFQVFKTAAFKAKYTISMNGDTNSATLPGGYSGFTATVDGSGNATLSGTLAEATAVSCSAPLSSGGIQPVFVPLYGNKGMLIGWLDYTNTEEDSEGETFNVRADPFLIWLKPNRSTDKFYANGIDLTTPAYGSKLTFNTFGWSEGGMLVTEYVGSTVFRREIQMWFSNNKLTPVDSSSLKNLSVAADWSKGTFQGKFTHPSTGKSTVFKGVLFKTSKGVVGQGWFLGQYGSGYVLITPH